MTKGLGWDSVVDGFDGVGECVLFVPRRCWQGFRLREWNTLSKTVQLVSSEEAEVAVALAAVGSFMSGVISMGIAVSGFQGREEQSSPVVREGIIDGS